MLRDTYRAPLERVDFVNNPRGSVDKSINRWVEEQTGGRIQELDPHPGVLESLHPIGARQRALPQSRLADGLSKGEHHAATISRVRSGGDDRRGHDDRHGSMGLQDFADFTAVSVPYDGGELQLLLFVPKAVDGIGATQTALTAAVLAKCARH